MKRWKIKQILFGILIFSSFFAFFFIVFYLSDPYSPFETVDCIAPCYSQNPLGFTVTGNGTGFYITGENRIYMANLLKPNTTITVEGGVKLTVVEVNLTQGNISMLHIKFRYDNYLRDSIIIAFFYAVMPTIFYFASIYSELD